MSLHFSAWVAFLGASPRSHRSTPCNFFGGCDSQAAIDFAEAAYLRKAWSALHLSLTFSKLLDAPPRSNRSPPRTFFCKCILQAAIDFAGVRKRGCGAIAKQLEERALSAKPA